MEVYGSEERVKVVCSLFMGWVGGGERWWREVKRLIFSSVKFPL
jgi:hypothetical protein